MFDVPFRQLRAIGSHPDRVPATSATLHAASHRPADIAMRGGAVVGLVFMLSFGLPAFADESHCVYRLYSAALDKSVKVCEIDKRRVACGDIPDAKITRQQRVSSGSCPMAGARGVCVIGDRRLVFYEGDPTFLEIGCGYMEGIWSIDRNALKATVLSSSAGAD